MRERLAEARMALMLLTRLPAGQLAEPLPSVKACLWAFPLVGLLVGGVGALVGLAALRAGLPPLMAAALVLGAQMLITGALHEDGLADMADGLGGGRDKAHALDIMRDSRLGSYGTLILLLSVLLRAVGIATLLQGGAALLALPALAAASRAAMGVLLVALPPARADGLGHGAATSAAPLSLIVTLVLGALVLLALGLHAALAVLAAMALAVFTVGWLARRKICGQTGDILGATQQASEVAGLVVLSASALGP